MTKDHDSDPSTAVVFRTYSNRMEAQLIASMLRDAGILVTLAFDDVGGTYPSLNPVRGVKLLVRSQDAELAERVLADAEPLADDEELTDPESSADG